MIQSITITDDTKLTNEQIERIKQSSQFPIVFDEDCPELSIEELKKFAPIIESKQHA